MVYGKLNEFYKFLNASKFFIYGQNHLKYISRLHFTCFNFVWSRQDHYLWSFFDFSINHNIIRTVPFHHICPVLL